EATRECLRDVFDVPALREVMADLRARTTRLVAVETDKASPFSQSLLFSWIAVYMYEGDAPLAERRAAALSLDRDLLRELLGTDELRELLDAGALDEVELSLQRLGDGRRARHADAVHDLLRELGPLREGELAARTEGDASALLATLVDERRAIPVRIAGEDRFAAVEDASRLRDALGGEVEPVGGAALGRFLPAWQGADRPRGGADALTEAIGRLQGAAIPASILETDVLPARVRGFRPADLDALCASGELVWVGAGALGATDGRVSLLFRDRAGLLAPSVPAPEDRPAGPLHDAIRERLASRGASFWPDL